MTNIGSDQAVDRILARTPLTVPTLLVDSLWDQEDIYGAPAVYEAVKRSPNAHLVLGPWHHGQANGPAMTLGPLDFNGDTGKWFRANVMIPFLDQYLKDGPPANIARVTAFEAQANQWRRLPDWPPACMRGCPANLTPLYPVAGGGLGFDAATAQGYDSYVSDPAKPVTYRSRPNLSPWTQGSTWRYWLLDDQRFAEGRPDVLSYSSDVLRQPLKLAGTPLVHLVASTSGTDSDWVVKLIDVYPDQYPQKPELGGYQLAIAMDVMRGRYRDDPAQTHGGAGQPAGDLRIFAAECGLHAPARPPPDGPGPVELVPALRPQPADLRPQHLLRQAAGLSAGDTESVHRPRRDLDRAAGVVK